MANLDPVADKAVRDAVDAFMEGRLTPEFTGETIFETKNSRYRLLDGVVFAAPDDSLIGSELVGWLMESARRSVVESSWQPGSRAVLVDRQRQRNIIVTSTTRLLHLEERLPQARAEPMHRPAEASPLPFSPRSAAILPSTPPPYAPVAPAAPDGGAAGAPVPPWQPASPGHSAAVVQKRAAAIHLPPRPIASPSPATPTPLPQPSRAVPLPVAPPRRDAPPALAQIDAQPPLAEAPAWELTSAEFEMDGEATDPDIRLADPSHYDAPHQEPFDSSDQPTPEASEAPGAPESSGGSAIPLVKPIDLPRPGVARPRR